MSEQVQLEKAIAAVEAQRASLGDTAVDAVLDGLRRKLASLEAADHQPLKETVEQTSASERRIVTVLFCDVAGSTSLAEKLDPETWAEIMDEAFEYLTEPVDRFGGTVAQLIGDAVLAFFGAPVAHEDDPERAILAGLAIFENIQTFREKLRRDQGMDFDVRVGINTGLVVTGKIGSKLHEGYTALGDAVNLATRIEATAQPGTVQVSEHTHKMAAQLFEFEEAGGIDIEGKKARLRTYRVLGRKRETGESRGLAPYGVASSLIGRDTELKSAQAAIGRLLSGRGGIIIINGEAGIGKSRLVHELRKQSQGESLTWLNGRTLSYGESISYRPIQGILRQYSGIGDEDSESEAWGKLEESVQNLFAEGSPVILPYLASLMTIEAQGDYVERVRFLDGEAMRDQILVASRRFFERLAVARPLVLVFEDFQWVDASSARLLERLLPLTARVSLLICCVSRLDTNPTSAQLGQIIKQDYSGQIITLSPLSKVDSAQLVSTLLENDELSARTREMIVQKADGNPFFLEEIIRDLIDEGALVLDADGGRWRATARIETINIPDTIQGVITARIDRLDKGVKRVLRAAAVIGQSFRVQVLSAVLKAEQALDQQLAVLQTAELIRVKQTLPELEYIFRNGLAQEATYQSILLQTRRRLHARVGQAIESLFADRLEEFYGLLAYHYAQAEAWEPAQGYLLKAGDQAGQVAASAEALTHYRRALKAYENVFGQNWDPLQRATLARKMGEAYYGLGQLAESREFFQNALALLDRPLPQSRLGLLTGVLRQIGRQATHRFWPSRFVARAPAEKREALREVVRSYERLGVIFYIEGEAASSIYAFLRSLNLAEPAGPSPELARAYANNVIASGLIPPLRFMADQYSQLALEIARKGEDLAALAWVWQLTGIYCTGIGRWQAAIDAEEQAADINKRIGRLRWREESVGILAQVLHISGDYTRSRELYLEMTTSSQERGDRQTQVWALAGRVENGLRVGGPGYLDELIDYLEQAQALMAEHRYPNRPDQIQIISLLAQVRFRRKEWELARQVAARAVELIASEWPPSTFYTFEAYAGIPVVYMGLWQAAERGHYVAPAHESYRKLALKACRRLHSFARVFPIAKPRAWLWQGAYEWLVNRRGKAHKLWQRSLDQAERLNMPYDLGLAHYEIGRHLPVSDPTKQEHLRHAEQIFSQLGAAWDLERAQNTLGQG